jgi:hypothetical protein
MEKSIQVAEDEAKRAAIRAGKKPEITDDEGLAKIKHQTRMKTLAEKGDEFCRREEEDCNKHTQTLEEQWRTAPPPKTPSPTRTETLHPSYPYHKHTTSDNDLSPDAFKHPYLAMKVDRFTGDPHIYG